MKYMDPSNSNLVSIKFFYDNIWWLPKYVREKNNVKWETRVFQEKINVQYIEKFN